MLQKCGSSRGDKADYYFDSQNRYEVIANITATIPLASIIEVKRETTRIGKRSIWSVDWLKEGQQKQARFLHNDTLFNQSFATFLDVVKQVNPDARVTSLTLFTL